MAASETVRLRLQFDYPPPATPHCTVFWLLVDLNRCRVVTDLISLIRQRFGFSSGALLGLYLEGGLLPPAESARLVRDNDCLRCAGARGRGVEWGWGRGAGVDRTIEDSGGELAASRHVRENLSGPARDGASFPRGASHFRGTRLGAAPVLKSRASAHSARLCVLCAWRRYAIDPPSLGCTWC